MNEIQRMRNEGMSYDEIREMVEKMEKEEQHAKELAEREAEAKRKESEMLPARMKFTEAVGNYLLAVGLITPEELAELDPKELADALKEMEDGMRQMLELRKAMQMLPNFSTRHRNPQKTYKPDTGEATVKTDNDILRGFLDRL